MLEKHWIKRAQRGYYRYKSQILILLGTILLVLTFELFFGHRAFVRELLIIPEPREDYIRRCPPPLPPPALKTVKPETTLGSEYTFCPKGESSEKCINGKEFDADLVKRYGIDKIVNSMTPLNDVSRGDFVASTVITTGSSSNHFEESLAGLASIQSLMKCFHIVYWDLGLTLLQRRELKKICGLEIRTFPFEKYPAHVSNLVSYAWKPMIILELMSEYSGVVWIDSSIRFRHADFVDRTYGAMVETDGVLQFSIGHNFPYDFTHPHMFDYIPTDIERFKKILSLGEGNSFAFFKTPQAVTKVLYWFWLCSLTEDCIAPPGHCRKPPIPFFGAGLHIHRYDQSAIGILNENLFNFDHRKYIRHSLGVTVGRAVLDGGMGVKWCV